MTDCLIIGFNDSDFSEYVQMVGSMGKDSGAYRDLDLAFITCGGEPLRSMDILNHFYAEGRGGERHRPFSNVDFLWPVVTYLGSYLTQRGFSFDYVNLFHLEKDKLRDKLVGDDILTIAITTTLYVSPQPILEIISFIREHNHTAKIIVGGPYISNQPKLCDGEALQSQFKYLGADIYVISSEGEGALVQIIGALKNRTSLDRVDNIAYRDGESYRLTATSIESNPLEENPVDYSLFPAEEFGQFVTLRTAKSCPFSCSFCGFPQRAGKYKYTGVELVERELNAIRDLGTVTTLTFIDDTFNVPKERFKEICRMMIRNNYGFKWNSFYRSDHGDEEAIELMGRAGCEGVFLGIESGSDAMLKRMNKTARRKDYLKSIPLLKAAGVSTHANVIVGFPGETFDTVRETVDLIEEARPDFFRAQLWYADPVTPIWEQREAYGVKGSSFNWSHDTMDFQMACDLVDKMFLSIQNSIWLPQNGFEQWSTFYLQRKGMSMGQLKTFLKSFNAAVKEKLINPKKEEVDPELLESLKRSCQFDRPAAPSLAPVEVFSGENYARAEEFWCGEFSEPVEPGTETLREQTEADADAWPSASVALDWSLLDDVRSIYGVENLSAALLAAYSVLLSRLSGREDVALVAVLDEAGADERVPLRLNPSWRETFGDFLRRAQLKLAQARRQRLHAFHILTNPYRMAQHGGACPSFDAGYLYRHTWPGHAETSFAEALSDYPSVAAGVKLVLQVDEDESGRGLLRFSYSPRWFTPEVIDKLSSYLTSVLTEVCNHPDDLLGELALEQQPSAGGAAVSALAGEVFNF